MDVSYFAVLLLIVAFIAVPLISLYTGENKTVPAWLRRTAFRIRLLSQWLLSVEWLVGIAVLILFLIFLVPPIIQEGVIWLFPQTEYGYAMKYNVKKVIIDRQPRDCEWGTAPLGTKHCHYEKVVQTETDQKGKVTAVHVSWQKVQD